jgi:predicted phage terminase large subunit-like protein
VQLLADDLRLFDLAADDIALDRALVARNGLWQFVQLAWEVIEADPLVPSWHMEEICNHLEAVSRGECRRLIITVPPGCSKSRIVSVLWPVWDWIKNPKRKWMFATFDQTLMHRDAIDCRKLVRSAWFQARWPELNIAASKDDQTTQSVYSTTKGGRRVSVTVSGKATGWHAEIQVVDDPTKPADIRADPEVAATALERTWQWWRGTMASRRSNPKKFSRVIIMQRLHELDLVGRIMEESPGEYTLLSLPMEFEPERKCVTKWGGDRRTFEGELLVPSRFDADAVAEAKRDMGSQVAAAQLQQRPTPGEGNIFKRDWFNARWETLPAGVHFLYIISADCTFKDSSAADYVAIHVWAYGDGKFYLVDRINDRLGLPATVACMLALAKRWPQARGKLIEDKANGPAVEQVLRGRMPGIIMREPQGGKVARANAVSPLAEAFSVVLPAPNATLKAADGTTLTYAWVEDMIEELCAFPFARHDDDVDAMTQALIYLHDSMPPRYLKAMRQIASGNIHRLVRGARR